MTKRKERSIAELYHVTERIPEAEMTPVLKGNCRIQGPMDETNGTEKKTSSSRLEKRFSRRPRSTTGKVSVKAESGTCNVCAAPCSSCRHFNQTSSCMEVKAEIEFSDQVSGVNAASRCSFDDASVTPSVKKRVRTGRNPAASETSNLLSASSSHDSISENAESKASLRTFDTKEDVEMLPKVSLDGAVAHDQLLTKPQGVTGQSANISSIGDVTYDAGQRTLANKSEVQNSCNGDDVSCISGANDAHIPVRDLNVDVDRKNVSCSTASVSSLSPDGFEKKDHVQSDPDRLAGSQDEGKDKCNNSRGAHMFSEKSKQKDHLISSSNEKLPQKSAPSEFPLSKDCLTENPKKLPNQSAKSVSCNEDAPNLENSKSSLICSSFSGTSMKDDSCLEVGIAMEKAEPPAKSMEHLEINEQIEKSSVLPKVPSNQDPPLHSQSVDVSDGSDIVEDDVKVCDICGDAGREDLLAICSRCSDGAEHTYCMRIMVDKVPEGDWLCEVCQLKEEAADQKKDKCEAVVETPKISSLNEKNRESVRTLDSKVSVKSDTQFSDEEANRATKVAPSPRLSSKRHSDSLEVPSAAKQQALESSAGSPKPSSPSRTNTLSRERSFKNLDKGKVKSINPIPSLGGSSFQDKARPPTPSVQNSSKVHPQLQSPRGTLLKSNSFNTSNTKAKVKMVQDDVPQKSKLGKYPSTSGSRKEAVGTFSKSSSFNIGSSHSASIESKAKVHSSNVSRTEDLRGIKLGKDRNTLERRNSFKSDRAASIVSSPKDEQRVSSRGEIVPLPSSATKFRDMKAVQADGRLSASSKSTSLLSHRGSETPNPSAGRGEFKRQSSLVSRGGGYSSFNGNSAEQNLSQVNPKDEIAAKFSCTADGPDMVSQDGLPRSQEFMDPDKKGEEPSFNQARQSVPAAGKSIRCQKCKEIGHAAQVCPNGSIRVCILEATAARSSREVINRSTKSKDANEASSVKSSGICKKNGLPDQSDELSTSSTEEMAPKKQLSNLGIFTSSDQACDRQESFKNYSADSGRSTAVTNVKQNAFQPRGGGSSAPREVDLNAIVSSDENQLMASLCDAQNQDSSVAIPSRGSPIPEQDYIWQGGFEVQKSGRHLDSFDGIQAHLSTCASPKVLEVVNNLPPNVLLEEVSRSSTWPTQFQNYATEDNIALYFFAKDVESYIRNYESFVENMMKNDLALKGILDGIELLIFPSNQLCEKSKRWNMIYFLWGVFRAKRAHTSEKVDGSLENLSAANLNVVPLEEKLPSPVMAVPRNDSSSGNIDEDLLTLRRSLNGQEAINTAALVQLPSSSSSGRVDTKNYQEESSSDQKCLGLETKSSSGHIDLNSHSSLMNPTSSVQLCTSIKGNDTLMEHGYPENKEEKEPGECVQEAREENFSLTKGKTVLLDDINCRLVYPEETSSLSQDASAVESRIEVNVQERMNNQSRYEVTRREKVRDEEGMLDADFVLENDLPRSDLMENDHGSREIKSYRKRPYSTTVEMVPQASGESSACTSQLMAWKAKEDGMLVEGENECKKMKRIHNETNSNDSSRGHNSLIERYASQKLDLGSSFTIKEGLDDAYDGTVVVPLSLMTTERHFFPVESGPLKDVGVRGTSIPVQVISSDDEDQLEYEHPNLDLALGGEKKSQKLRTDSLFELYAKKKNVQGKCPEIITDLAEDDSLDSLSLSLAVPLSNKMVQMVKPVAKPEPERNHRDNSLFLSGGFSGT